MVNKRGFALGLFIAIVGVVLAIIIILVFWKGLNPGEEVDKQVCYQSVVKKATAQIEDTSIFNLPLNCQTEKICVTSNILFKGNCDYYYQGEEYITVTVSGKDFEIEDEINKLIAEKMRECWWMMGHGDTNVFSRTEKDNEDFRECLACTRIAFAQDVKDKLREINGEVVKEDGEISEEALLKGSIKYRLTHTLPDSETTTYQQDLTNSQSNYIYGYSEETDVIDTSPKAVIFYEVGSGTLNKWLIKGGTGAAGLLAGAKLGGMAGAAVGSIVPVVGNVGGALIGAGIGAIGGWIGGDFIAEKFGDNKFFAGTLLVDDDVPTLRASGCTSFRESSGAQGEDS